MASTKFIAWEQEQTAGAGANWLGTFDKQADADVAISARKQLRIEEIAAALKAAELEPTVFVSRQSFSYEIERRDWK